MLQSFGKLFTKLAKVELKDRHLWGYVAIAFNTVDWKRLEEVGPDRLCAEWVIKNGGKIGFLGQGRLLGDYNSLPPAGTKLKVQVVDATDATVMKIGLEHFKGCHNIDTVIFDNCKYLEDDGLQGLEHVKKTLKKLQVTRCDNMKDNSFDVIGELDNLQKLHISKTMYVKNYDAVVANLKSKLPHCEIEF